MSSMSSMISTAVMRMTASFDSSQQKSTSFTSRVLTDPNPIEIQDNIHSVRFLDGEHVVTGGWQENIRRWQVANGKEVGKPMNAGNPVFNVAVSQDGKQIVCGTQYGQVTVWNAANGEKVIEFQAHEDQVQAVDISADGKKFVTGSDDRTVSVWSFPTGEKLLGPLRHDTRVAAVKFSPGGKYLATASSSVRVYESHDGQLHADFPMRANSSHNESLAWARAANLLFALSRDGEIHCLEVSTKETLAKWRIHSDNEPKCIALACNDTVIIASVNSSLSLWDTTTQQHIGTVICHTHNISSMAISSNCDIATAGNKAITVRNLSKILPDSYREDVRLERELRRLQIEKPDLYNMVMDIRTRDARKMNMLEKNVRELRDQLSTGHLEQTVQDLRKQLTASQNALRAHDKRHECKAACAHGRIYDVAQSLVEIANMMTKDLKPDKSIIHQLGTLLTGVAKVALRCHTANEVLRRADKFKPPKFKFHVYRAVCDALESDDSIPEAIQCLRKLQHELSQETSVPDERSQWELGFQQRCIRKLEKEGDAAMESKNHDAAIGSYSSALSLSPANISNIIVKCCKATEHRLFYIRDRRKHALLHNKGHYEEAFKVFKAMLSRMDSSPDPRVRDMRNRYLDATPQIRMIVEQTIRDIPHVLIDTTTGRLYDKAMQASAFEKHTIFNELRSSMTTRDLLDLARIKKEVEKFYEYVMFSHRWQPPEPTFQLVENALICGLPPSPANDKLIKFCKLVQSRRFRWAWSDTCCVNQSDNGVQQESVIAMFRWYRQAALTIVHLLGVHSKSQKKGSMRRSIWNMRGWTYQEYVASKVIQFYTEDWQPYLDLEIFNHKDSRIILEEMEQATSFTTEALATLQPGLMKVREKLYLASKRQTTREEDIAYCLFGIFGAALPVIYGEGNQAVGRLLEHILSRSCNITILSWTGISGNNHSYLPSDLTVYNQVLSPHVPQPVNTVEMNEMVMNVQSCYPNTSPTVELYERLHDLPPLSLVAGRLRLRGLVFPIDNLKRLSECDSDTVHPVYYATILALGDVRIETKDELVGMEGLVLIHPWISPLIDEDFAGSTPQFDLVTRSLRLLVRLRQPFGALLLASEGRMEYKRIATDSFIKAQILSEMPLEELMQSIRTVDVQ